MGYDVGTNGYPAQAAGFGNWGNYGMPMGNPYQSYNTSNAQGFWGNVVQPNYWMPQGFNTNAYPFQSNASGYFGGVGRNFSYDAPPQLDFPMPDLGTLFGGRDQYSDINYPGADLGFTTSDDFFAPNDNTGFDWGSNRLADYFTNLNPLGSNLRDSITNFGNDVRSSILGNFGDDARGIDNDPNGLRQYLADLAGEFGDSFDNTLHASFNSGRSSFEGSDFSIADLLGDSGNSSRIFVNGNEITGQLGNGNDLVFDWSDEEGNSVFASSSSSGNTRDIDLGNFAPLSDHTGGTDSDIDLSGLNDALAGLNNLFGNGNGLRV